MPGLIRSAVARHSFAGSTMPALSRIKSRITSPFLRRGYRRLRSGLRSLKKDVREACRQEHAGVYLNWFTAALRRDTMAKIHWTVTRTLWRERKLYTVLSALVWPVKAAILAVSMTRQHGAFVKQRTGQGRARQFLAQVRLAFRHSLAPRAYYFYGLYEAGNERQASLYVQDHEILPLLRSVMGNVDYQVFDDKRRFHAECRRLGLPTIPIIAEFESGSLKQWGDCAGARLPHTDLFAKPALGKCGKGVMTYAYESPGRYRRSDGMLLAEDGLLAELAACSQETPYILQPRYRSHPAIASVSAAALCTSRVVTCRMPDGRCEEIMTIFKMPAGECCTDNMSTGGIAVAVDARSGELGSAISKGLDAARTDVHPATGKRISGMRIPRWQEARALCLRAQAAFPDYAFIGWDVAVTGEGPMLVEGNLRWGVESMQRAQGPLGQTRFAEGFLSHCELRSSAQARASAKDRAAGTTTCTESAGARSDRSNAMIGDTSGLIGRGAPHEN